MGLSLSRFKVDKQRATEGVRVELGQGAWIRVARAKNARFVAFVQDKLAPYANQVRLGTLDPAIMMEVTVEAVARHILLDWGGLLDAEGEELPYSVENAIQVLTELEEFAEIVDKSSTDKALFRADQVESAVGKSSALSDGTTSGETQAP